jgi:hypothetical protein
MFTTTTENSNTIRNYFIAAASVMLLCAGTADLFNSPSRAAQQDQLNNYGRYISAGLVNYAQTLGR